jgi:hypothetical protein
MQRTCSVRVCALLTTSHATCTLRQYLYFCTSQPTSVLRATCTLDRRKRRLTGSCTLRAMATRRDCVDASKVRWLRQYLYFCTSQPTSMLRASCTQRAWATRQ